MGEWLVSGSGVAGEIWREWLVLEKVEKLGMFRRAE